MENLINRIMTKGNQRLAKFPPWIVYLGSVVDGLIIGGLLVMIGKLLGIL